MIYTTELNNENFNEMIGKNEVVLVDIWATWCKPCQVLSPILNQVSDDLGEKILLAKVDVDANNELCQRLNVRNIPTLLFYKNGELMQRTVGVMQKNEILDILTNIM